CSNIACVASCCAGVSAGGAADASPADANMVAVAVSRWRLMEKILPEISCNTLRGRQPGSTAFVGGAFRNIAPFAGRRIDPDDDQRAALRIDKLLIGRAPIRTQWPIDEVAVAALDQCRDKHNRPEDQKERSGSGSPDGDSADAEQNACGQRPAAPSAVHAGSIRTAVP